MIKKAVDEKSLLGDYSNGMNLLEVCKKYHIGKLYAKEIILKNGGIIRKPSSFNKRNDFIVSDWKIEKYPNRDGYHYIAVLKDDSSVVFNDIKNKSGLLTTTIKEKYSIETPSLYDRRTYYQKTGNYWWEQWFDVKCIENAVTKKCPYCDWETVDIENKSGAFETHLKKVHNIRKEEYLSNHPEDKTYFSLVNPTLNLQMDDKEDDFVICAICGKKLTRIDSKHLNKHNITKEEYIAKYGNCLVSKNLHSKLSKITTEENKQMTFHKESNAEKELKDTIIGWGVNVVKNRKVLNGKEIDIFLPDYNLGIEFNGDFYHTEWRHGKGKNYHLNKTEQCENKNIRLIQIFEDEWHNSKILILSKLRHILGIDNSERIMGRKCTVSEITLQQAKDFLNKHHIQGFVSSSVYLGAFYDESLIAVMNFKKYPNEWELTRYASDINYKCVGVSGKLLHYFIKSYNPNRIKSFADRRWSTYIGSNLYTKLGFTLDSILPPDYKYYNQKVNRYARYHKFNFRKQILHKRYGFPLTMTETEMVKKLGYDRIWDCGLIKYVWEKEGC